MKDVMFFTFVHMRNKGNNEVYSTKTGTMYVPYMQQHHPLCLFMFSTMIDTIPQFFTHTYTRTARKLGQYLCLVKALNWLNNR